MLGLDKRQIVLHDFRCLPAIINSELYCYDLLVYNIWYRVKTGFQLNRKAKTFSQVSNHDENLGKNR